METEKIIYLVLEYASGRKSFSTKIGGGFQNKDEPHILMGHFKFWGILQVTPRMRALDSPLTLR